MNTPIRRWKRTKIDMRVRLRRAGDPNDSGVVVRTYEISEGGMSLYVPDPFEPDTPVTLEFILPGSPRQITVSAFIRNRRGFRHGLEFVDVSEADRAEITSYLAAVVDVIEI